jgi:hypothetical protein
MNQPRNRINDYSTKTTSPTLTARMGTGGNQVPIVHSVSDTASGFKYRQGAKAGGGVLGGQRNPNQRKVGCLNARDYKGVGSQYVDEGKLVIDDSQ